MQLTAVMVPCNWLMQVICNLFMIQGLGVIGGSYVNMQDRDWKLRIFTGNEHPFGDRPVEPYVVPPRQVPELRPGEP